MSEAKGPYFANKMNDVYYTLSGPRGSFGMYIKNDAERWASMFNDAWASGRSSRDGLRKALELVSTWWFDPKDEKSACGECDANLHPNAMGKHIQLNGDPCPFQVAKEALEADGEGK